MSTGRVMPRLKRAIKLHMYDSSGSFAERFDDLAGVGLDGVEIGFDETLPVAEIARATSASGLAVPTLIVGSTFDSSLTSPGAAERATAADAVVRTIDAANALGSGAVMISPGWDRADLHPADTARLVRDALSEAVRVAESAGVTIAVENLWNGWLTSPADLVAFVDSFESGNVGVLFDSGNAARFSAPQHWITILGPRMVRFDVKDYKYGWALKPATVYAPDDQLRAAWGEDGPWGALDALLFDGDVSWPRVASALAETGYDGWVCAEHGAGDLEWIRRFTNDLGRLDDLVTTNGRTS
jgi:hexulose-6-phosphate isomerase